MQKPTGLSKLFIMWKNPGFVVSESLEIWESTKLENNSRDTILFIWFY